MFGSFFWGGTGDCTVDHGSCADNVFNLSLCSGYIHCTLKTSVLKPLYKSDSRSDFSNYRPISILSAVVKLLEKCVCKQLCLHLERNNILYSKQFGFRANHCTEFAILQYCETVHSALVQ